MNSRRGATRVCPGCARRDTMLVDPDCPICDGTGVLHLVPLVKYSDEVIADAVEYALEAAARDVQARNPASVITGEAQQALRGTVAALRAVKVIAPAPVPRERPAPRPSGARERHELATRLAGTAGVRPSVSDAQVLAAPPVDWWRVTRPLDRGGIPGFSAAGYVCAIARAVDPYDPLRRDPRADSAARVKRRREAESLALFAVDTAAATASRSAS